MKKLFLFTSLSLVIAFGGVSAYAQCNPASESLIKCGYYNEGYQDGISDAQSNRSDDYRRYRNKYENKYENNYERGYSDGYDSIRPSTRWTNSQRSAYDSGYTIGQSDRRNNGQTRNSESAVGQYDQTIGLYFQQGYSDGFSNRPRQYDVALGTGPIYPPNGGGGGNTMGTAVWNGRVDNRANIIIRGNTMLVQDDNGNDVQTTYQNIIGSLPRRPTIVSANKADGRGEVTVTQQPSQANNFTAIVQVYDPKGGAGNYKVNMSWQGPSNVEEPYRSGNVSWRGRVDQTVNIVISGGEVQTVDTSGTGVSGVGFNINGYLARRPGSIIAQKRNGRGTVTILQQPSWNNDFTAIVQIFDPKGGADNYEVDINW